MDLHIDKLKKQRRMLGLTQHQLSLLAGMPLGRITYAESGRGKLTARDVQRIQNVFRKRAEKISTALEAEINAPAS